MDTLIQNRLRKVKKVNICIYCIYNGRKYGHTVNEKALNCATKCMKVTRKSQIHIFVQLVNDAWLGNECCLTKWVFML